jgi:hypothetical protein
MWIVRFAGVAPDRFYASLRPGSGNDRTIRTLLIPGAEELPDLTAR